MSKQVFKWKHHKETAEVLEWWELVWGFLAFDIVHDTQLTPAYLIASRFSATDPPSNADRGLCVLRGKDGKTLRFSTLKEAKVWVEENLIKVCQ